MRYHLAMKIGELARHSGVSTKAIRYYEDIGVLPQPRRETNGYRRYDDVAIERIAFIRDAQATGLSLVEIQVILELRDEGESTCGHVIQSLEMHLEDLDRQVEDLHRTKGRLEEIISRARKLDPTECRDPNRCQTISPNPLLVGAGK